MIKTIRLRGGSWGGRVLSLDTNLHCFRVAVENRPLASMWIGDRISPRVNIATEEYERFAFYGPSGRMFYRYYHRDHYEYKMLVTGSWNSWWQNRVRNHIYRRDSRSYAHLVRWAIIRAILEPN
jgi:hypothetical protein